MLLELDTRDGGGGALARRGRVARSSAGSCCRTSCPGILSGVALAFARAVGEIGAVVIISGNQPYRTEVASVYVFNLSQSGDRAGAAAVAVVLLAISFVLLLASAASGASQRGTSVRRRSLRVVALGYLLVILLGPLAMVFWRTFEKGSARPGRR